MKIKILLAEDDTSLGFMISDQLKSEGYSITLCSDGAEAYKRFNDEKFHLCIFDVMMPKKDGFTLAKDIRKLDSEIPILFLTAKSMTEDKVEGFKSGGDDYLTKPFSVEELQVRLTALLKRVHIITETPEEKIKKIKDEALEKFLLSLNNATDYSCTVSKHFDFADLIAIRHFMHNVDFEKLLKLAHIRGWKHSKKWSHLCPVCLVESEFTIKALT